MVAGFPLGFRCPTRAGGLGNIAHLQKVGVCCIIGLEQNIGATANGPEVGAYSIVGSDAPAGIFRLCGFLRYMA